MAVVFSILGLFVLFLAFLRLLSIESDYRSFEFPWYKRPIGFWGIVITALIIALVAN